MAESIQFDNSYQHLPERFYSRLAPTPVSQPGLIRLNQALAGQLGIGADWLSSPGGIEFLAGNRVPTGAEPIATVYAGHQFGNWVPQLGDGRAILLGEVIGRDGQRYDIQLKGSGRTPYSRNGDGRAPLGPVLREYIVSEAMAALGVPTSRALAAVSTGDAVYREGVLPGAVLTRVAQSHIRIGTFQYFYSQRDHEGLRLLADHVITRHYPGTSAAANPVQALLEAVVATQARLIAQWQLLGFIHGVMNTDNMLLSGFHPNRVFSSIDHQGRYAYGNQPGIAHWNLANLAQALLPLLDEDTGQARERAQAAIDVFPDLYQAAYRQGLARKLGLAAIEEGDEALASDLLGLMAQEQIDFTLSFRRLADLVQPGSGQEIGELFEFPEAFTPWLQRWRQRTEQDPQSPCERQAMMYRASPAFIPRNHMVEAAIASAEADNDFALFNQLVDLLGQPHDYRPDLAQYARPPRPDQEVTRTFCGT
jgi:uncharacterized protein YdiU (UPF0061 family)